ncbi:MAG: hypothetical protein IT450_18695 [Phycisphaerales bacterium]|nr:hypothetical protein [Phycisphaerales bacterium]
MPGSPARTDGSPSKIFARALGVSLLVHVFNFFGVSYFGTITALWYLTLGVIGSLTPVRVPMPSTQPAKVAPRWANRPT